MIATTADRGMAVANAVQLFIVVEGRTPVSKHATSFGAAVESSSIELAPTTTAQARSTSRAWRRLRNGNHAAALHFRDYFAHALAEESRKPLLFRGTRLSWTDIAVPADSRAGR